MELLLLNSMNSHKPLVHTAVLEMQLHLCMSGMLTSFVCCGLATRETRLSVTLHNFLAFRGVNLLPVLRVLLLPLTPRSPVAHVVS
jgi:hypothetical protein